MLNQRQYWDRHAKNYDRSMAILGRPMPRMLELVADSVQGADTVLEVAAGTGLVTVAIAPRVREVIATDYSVSMVETLRRRVAEAGLSNVTCSQGDVYALPYASRSFDFVVAANVLHLLPDLPLPVCTPKGPSGFQEHGTRGWSGDRVVSMPISTLAVTPGGAGGADVPISALAATHGPIGLGDRR